VLTDWKGMIMVNHSTDWVAGKQYWLDNVHDQTFDRSLNQGQEIRMIDVFGRVDNLVVRRGASTDEISK
jgi:hypothetical protein